MHLPVDFNQTIQVGAIYNLPEQWQDLFLTEAAEKIKKFKGRGVRVRGDRLEFLGPFFFFSRKTDLLTPITSGWIEVRGCGTAATIRYRLSFRRVLWVALAMAAIILYVPTSNGLPITTALLLVAFTWFWLFFITVIIRVGQFDRLIEGIFDSVRFEKRSES